MNVKLFRDDALAEVVGSSLLVRGVRVSEMTPNRIAIPGYKTELEFRPNTIYRVETGVSIDRVTKWSELAVRPTSDIFKHGVQVIRVEVLEQNNEIVVFMTTMAAFQFIRTTPLFEMSIAGSAQTVTDVVLSVEKQKKESAPGLPTIHIKGRPDTGGSILEHLDNEKIAAANPADTKKVEDWINSGDDSRAAVDPNLTRPLSAPASRVSAATANQSTKI